MAAATTRHAAGHPGRASNRRTAPIPTVRTSMSAQSLGRNAARLAAQSEAAKAKRQESGRGRNRSNASTQPRIRGAAGVVVQGVTQTSMVGGIAAMSRNSPAASARATPPAGQKRCGDGGYQPERGQQRYRVRKKERVGRGQVDERRTQEPVARQVPMPRRVEIPSRPGQRVRKVAALVGKGPPSLQPRDGGRAARVEPVVAQIRRQQGRGAGEQKDPLPAPPPPEPVSQAGEGQASSTVNRTCRCRVSPGCRTRRP